MDGSGKVSQARAEKKAHDEYEKFRVIQDREFVSDFDRISKNILVKKKN